MPYGSRQWFGWAAGRARFAPALGLGMLIVVMIWGGGGDGSVQAQSPLDGPSFSIGGLAITTASGARHLFRVEEAKSRRQHAYGLMFRQKLAPQAGMLFDYHPPQAVSMWMKNTLIPLDMLFIDAKGRVHHIHERAIPHDLTAIPSRGRVRAVLELNGGTVDRLGLAVGDRVDHALFGHPVDPPPPSPRTE